MNNTDKLKPCPFCGSSEINNTSPPIVVDGVCWWVCPECIAISPLAKSVNDATEKWNTRANESKIAELTKQRDELKNAVEAVATLIDSSTGVAGLHLNGEVADWDSILEGGNFEGWLIEFSEALSTQEANK